jgi:hypothetical protein
VTGGALEAQTAVSDTVGGTGGQSLDSAASQQRRAQVHTAGYTYLIYEVDDSLQMPDRDFLQIQ